MVLVSLCDHWRGQPYPNSVVIRHQEGCHCLRFKHPARHGGHFILPSVVTMQCLGVLPHHSLGAAQLPLQPPNQPSQVLIVDLQRADDRGL